MLAGFVAQARTTGQSPLDNLSAHLADPWANNVFASAFSSLQSDPRAVSSLLFSFRSACNYICALFWMRDKIATHMYIDSTIECDFHSSCRRSCSPQVGTMPSGGIGHGGSLPASTHLGGESAQNAIAAELEGLHVAQQSSCILVASCLDSFVGWLVVVL